MGFLTGLSFSPSSFDAGVSAIASVFAGFKERAEMGW